MSICFLEHVKSKSFARTSFAETEKLTCCPLCRSTLFHSKTDLRYYFDLLLARLCSLIQMCVCVRLCEWLPKKKTISVSCACRAAFTKTCYSSSSHTFIRPLIIQLEAIPNILTLRAHVVLSLSVFFLSMGFFYTALDSSFSNMNVKVCVSSSFFLFHTTK